MHGLSKINKKRKVLVIFYCPFDTGSFVILFGYKKQPGNFYGLIGWLNNKPDFGACGFLRMWEDFLRQCLEYTCFYQPPGFGISHLSV